MKGINPYKVKIIHNKVLVKINAPVRDNITAGNTKLYVDTTFNPANHATTSGEIVAVCSKFHNAEWVPQIEVAPGDKVIFDFFEMSLNMDNLVDRYKEHFEDMFIEYENEYYVFINYHELFAKVSEGLTPLNGYVIYEGVEDEVKFGEFSKKNLSTKQGKAVAVGAPNVSYPRKDHSDFAELHPGDIFFFKNDMYRKLEYDLHATQNKNLYLVQLRYVNSKII